LSAIALLPLVWWLLRVVPPAPRRVSFPPLRLLLGLQTSSRTSARTPLWLVLLRLLLAFLVIAAVAHPLLNASTAVGGPLLVAIDNGWASAKQWPQKQAVLERMLDEAVRSGRPVILLPTAPPVDGSKVSASGLLPAGEAKGLAQAIEPHPWPTDRGAAISALEAINALRPMRVEWLTDGLDGPQAAAFAARLQTFGSLEVVRPPTGGTARLLMPPSTNAGDLVPKVRRAVGGQAETASVRALDGSGHTLAAEAVDFSPGATEADIHLRMPSELRNRVARLEIDGETTAGAVSLLDDRWRRRPVGLVDERGTGTSASPLLDDLYYVERAMSPFAELRRDRAVELLKRELSLAILPDQGSLPDDERRALETWVEQGGVLVRLAGPNLAHNPDDLLPVRLRDGGRTLGGTMSWTQPATVAPMPAIGPFTGLAVPTDLRVRAQVLAEPGVDLNDKTWARLEDGTPLITGARRGKGWLVLIHTTVWPAWSNLGLSGLFPQMMQRLLGLSQGVAGEVSDRPLPPAELLDGFGHLVPPSGLVEPIPPKALSVTLGPHHPPGYYGDESGQRAVNLAPEIGRLAPLPTPAGASSVEFGGRPAERDLQPPLLAAALCVLLLDMAAVLVLRGLIGRRRRGAAAAVVGCLLALVLVQPAKAADGMTLKAALETRLAYVQTGDSTVDETSRAGLVGLSQVLEQRTTAALGQPMGVDVERDALMVFPLLYWPVTGGQGPLSTAARDKVNDFMRHGGMILFDTRDGGDGSAERLRGLTDGLDIPPLAAVTEEHVLTRSFYLLRDMPGRTEGGSVFVQAGDETANDSVSPVVIGGNDWAAAWAVDRRGAALFAVVPGGEQQRELAYRFGVNLVMYALTGNYKSDQVHLPAILERLKR
jgi:hypothetical protein